MSASFSHPVWPDAAAPAETEPKSPADTFPEIEADADEQVVSIPMAVMHCWAPSVVKELGGAVVCVHVVMLVLTAGSP
jgi:hypothetical protein